MAFYYFFNILELLFWYIKIINQIVLGIRVMKLHFIYPKCVEKSYILIKTSNVNVSRCSSIVTQCDVRGRGEKVSFSSYNCLF